MTIAQEKKNDIIKAVNTALQDSVQKGEVNSFKKRTTGFYVVFNDNSNLRLTITDRGGEQNGQ